MLLAALRIGRPEAETAVAVGVAVGPELAIAF